MPRYSNERMGEGGGSQRKETRDLLVSPLKYTSPRRDTANLYQDALEEQMAPIAPPVGRRLMSAVSPHKMVLQDHLASG